MAIPPLESTLANDPSLIIIDIVELERGIQVRLTLGGLSEVHDIADGIAQLRLNVIKAIENVLITGRIDGTCSLSFRAHKNTLRT